MTATDQAAEDWTRTVRISRKGALPGWVVRQEAGNESFWSSIESNRPHEEGPLHTDPLGSVSRSWGGCKISQPDTGEHSMVTRQVMNATDTSVDTRMRMGRISNHVFEDSSECLRQAQIASKSEIWLSGGQTGIPSSNVNASRSIESPALAAQSPVAAVTRTRQNGDTSVLANVPHYMTRCSNGAQTNGTLPVPPERLKGHLKAFYAEKGFGFITCAVLGVDVFAHASGFLDVPSECGPGAEVDFELDEANPRPRALNIRILRRNDAMEIATMTGDTKSSPPRIKGRLRAFRPDKGYGFVACDDPKCDVFVHVNSFIGEQPDKCVGTPDSSPLGQEIEFTLDLKNPDRPRAIDAQIIGEAVPQPSSYTSTNCYGKVSSATRGWDYHSTSGHDNYDSDASKGGVVIADDEEETPIKSLAHALAKVLRDTEALVYVRHDGFTLLSEALSKEPVLPTIEALVPGCSSDLVGVTEGKPLPVAVLEAVRETVKASTNGASFELWDEEGADCWIRLEPAFDAGKKNSSATRTYNNDTYNNKNGGNDSSSGFPARDNKTYHDQNRSKNRDWDHENWDWERYNKLDRDKNRSFDHEAVKKRETRDKDCETDRRRDQHKDQNCIGEQRHKQQEIRLDDDDDGRAWWMGDSEKSKNSSLESTLGALSWCVSPMSKQCDLGVDNRCASDRGSNGVHFQVPDPWAGSADPWSCAIRARDEANDPDGNQDCEGTYMQETALDNSTTDSKEAGKEMPPSPRSVLEGGVDTNITDLNSDRNKISKACPCPE